MYALRDTLIMCDYYEDEKYIVSHIDHLITAIKENFDEYDLQRIIDDTEDYIYDEEVLESPGGEEWQDKRNEIFKAIGSFAKLLKEQREKRKEDEISTS